MQLREVSIEKFKEEIYPEYLTLFPKEERKPYKTIEETVAKEITKILEIVEKDTLVGFFILNNLQGNPYVHLDYFAILAKYQKRRYGSKAIQLLKEKYSQEEGIFIEIEKIGLGESNLENETRQRRANFYENSGFYKMNFEVTLFTVIYSSYLLPCSQKEIEEQKVIEEMLKMYTVLMGEERVKKYIKIIN